MTTEMQTLLKKGRNITKEVEALVAATKDLLRGSFISHEKITEVTGFDLESKYRIRLISKWKREILTRGQAIKAAEPKGTGYRFLTVDEQRVTEPVNLKRQANKRLRRAAACLGAIGDDELTEEQRRLRVAMLHQLAGATSLQQKQRAELSSWLSNPKTLPQANGVKIEES